VRPLRFLALKAPCHHTPPPRVAISALQGVVEKGGSAFSRMLIIVAGHGTGQAFLAVRGGAALALITPRPAPLAPASAAPLLGARGRLQPHPLYPAPPDSIRPAPGAAAGGRGVRHDVDR
jgi:hypothetical protein